MHVNATKGPQERLALRKAEKIGQSKMFDYYLEEAKKITEAEIKESEERRRIRESGVRNDLADIMMGSSYIDELFENSDLFGGIGFNYNFLKYLNNNIFKSDKDGFPF